MGNSGYYNDLYYDGYDYDLAGNGIFHIDDVLIYDGPINLGTALLAGDANLDDVVDSQDFTILKANFGTGTEWSQGDFNDDNVVDSQDFTILKRGYLLDSTNRNM